MQVYENKMCDVVCHCGTNLPALQCTFLMQQVIIQRDEAEKKVVKLAAEVEELKDLTEELKDRLSNYKVQAQAKEVS